MKNLGKIIYIYLSLLFIAFLCYFLFSCSNMSTGLGEEVDLEAPVISVKKLTCENIELTSFSGGVYCKRAVAFSGSASDNNKISRVYTQIKWADDENSEFKDFKNAKLSGGNWSVDLAFEREGVCYIKFVAEDPAKNISPKSTKVVTLFVDDTAPVASAWYIDREINGIQYGLKEKEELEALDLSLPENKDAAQNVAFTICANASDTMGIHAISIQIRDEEGKKICDIPNYATSEYAPKFRITHNDLTKDNPTLETGKHYLQIWYDSEDIVTVPDSNKSSDVMVEGGWFIWWPESDEPKVNQNDIAREGDIESINLHIKDLLSMTVFDDDNLDKAYVALLSESENSVFTANWDVLKQNPSKLFDSVAAEEQSSEGIIGRTGFYEPNSAEREKVFTLKTSDVPQTMHLYVIAWDKTPAHKIIVKDWAVRVTDNATPLLIIESPKNNAVPALAMDGITNAYVTVKGQTLDTAGCEYIEFVWVPAAINDKKSAAEAWLNEISNDNKHTELAPTGSNTVKMTKKDGMRLWSAKLNLKTNTSEQTDKFVRHEFNFKLDLFNDFVADDGTNEKAKEKYFLIKLTRKDGNSIYRELTLSADEDKPTIRPKSPAGKNQNVGASSPLLLEFNATKPSGLPMDSSKYHIYRKAYSYRDNTENKTEGMAEISGHYDSTSGTYKATISVEELNTYTNREVNPEFTFYAMDLFGFENSDDYPVRISSLPYVTGISSPSSTLCKTGTEIIINVSFSDTVFVEGGIPYLNLEGFTSQADSENKAYYVDGSGSTTLQFKYKVKEGDFSPKLTIPNDNPIILNGAESLASDKVITSPVPDGQTLQDKKVITVDGKSPTCTITVTSTADNSENKYDDIVYLREGRILRATVVTNENVTVQGSPKFLFRVNAGGRIELPLESTEEKRIVFSKKISKNDVNGLLSFTVASCIDGYNVIKDNAGNPIIMPATVSSDNFAIDTQAPEYPNISLSVTPTDDGKYKDPVTFTLSNGSSDVVYNQYSTDNGTNWENGITKKLTKTAQLTAKAIDRAGNESPNAPTHYLYINSTFPDFTFECTKPDGYYKAGNELEFKLSFADKIKITSLDNAFIQLTGLNAGDIVGGSGSDNQGKAKLKRNTQLNHEIDTVYFTYEIQDPDQFTLKVNATDVKLNNFVDSYGVEWSNETWNILKKGTSYERASLHCDGVAPKVISMTPDGAKGNNVYTNGKKITLKFSEKIQRGNGKIYLRQVAGWAIPPVLTSKEFSIIRSTLSASDLNILSMQENGHDMEDYEITIGNNPHNANDSYYGTGQFVGPYKKSMQGLMLSGGEYVPDTSVKYVLAYDLDIWDTDESITIPVGKTFTPKVSEEPNDENKKTSKGYINDSEIITPSETRSTQQIREVLERAKMHQRELDVTSTKVKIEDDKQTVILNFPDSLLEKSALEDGRKWELVIEKEAFMDETGNLFGAESDGSIKEKDMVQSANGTSCTQSEDFGTWGRGRTSTENPAVLIKNGTNEFFWSDKVASPWIRVDGYSYGYGIKQPKSVVTLETILNDSVTPSGRVRVRIDCETEGAKIHYKDDKTRTGNSNAATDWMYTSDNGGMQSFAAKNANASAMAAAFDNEADQKVSFLGGTNGYSDACKEYITALGKKDGFEDSSKAFEGVFKTVVQFIRPVTGSGDPDGLVADRGNGRTDYYIRGTTGLAGEPSYSPFPLRDSPVGSPFLRITFREATSKTNSKDFYWVSYEILVDSSYSAYQYGGGYYDWAKHWGLSAYGCFNKCTNMTGWRGN